MVSSLYLAALLSVVRFAHSTDIHAYTQSGCRGGPALSCWRHPADSCCRFPANAEIKSVAFNPLRDCYVGNWHEGTRQGISGCTTRVRDSANGIGYDVCLSQSTNTDFSFDLVFGVEDRGGGAAYHFIPDCLQNRDKKPGYQVQPPQGFANLVKPDPWLYGAGSRGKPFRKRDDDSKSPEEVSKRSIGESAKCKEVRIATLLGWEEDDKGVWVLEDLSEHRLADFESLPRIPRNHKHNDIWIGYLKQFGASYYDHWSKHPLTRHARRGVEDLETLPGSTTLQTLEKKQASATSSAG